MGYHRAPDGPITFEEGRGSPVKKLLLVALAAIGGLLVYRQIQADKAEQDLWTEATDSVPSGSTGA
ncbi:hypothetical protein E1283_34575 [Streptomyces hainanensis]|uniref:Uncharacterized protein n=1 Tax=Streptomyces hainanensis TaxID=402648 RepID=A0A4R4SIL7_9ACTN|nr:hypothetical protein E1283_34575 [Streptomyces hainanensis]